MGFNTVFVQQIVSMIVHQELVTQRSPQKKHISFGGALRDIQKNGCEED